MLDICHGHWDILDTHDGFFDMLSICVGHREEEHPVTEEMEKLVGRRDRR